MNFMLAFIQIWAFLFVIGSFVLFFLALYRLDKLNLPSKDFWFWTLFIFCMPMIGSIIFLTYIDKSRAK